jgi:HEAT repeat protein
MDEAAMAKARSSEAKLVRLRELRRELPSPAGLQELRSYLADSSNFVAAEAAEVAGEMRLTDLAPDLVEAFERFLINPEKKDKLCRAKIAIVEALNKMDFTDEGIYLRGVRYVQLEPVWGGSQDTAVPVRVACAFGLVRIRYRNVLALLVDLLADSEKGARVGAVQALTYSGTETASLLLRLKARLGDKEYEVISECLSGIMELNREQGISFVAEFLHSPEQSIQESALLALGSSRQPDAFEVLKTFAEQNQGELQEVADVALGLLRLPAATDYLLSVVSDKSRTEAMAALGGLAVHRHDPRVRERTAAGIAKNGDAALLELFEKRFRTNE